MGADLLLASLIVKKDRKLNWAAGRKVIKDMPLDDIKARLEEIHGEWPEGNARREANRILSDLKKELSVDYTRDGFCMNLPGNYVMHLRGGTSWGDSPSEGWDAIVNASYFPEVLKAVGFWYPRPRKLKDAA